jgi:anti-anti-sigma regulatory factor
VHRQTYDLRAPAPGQLLVLQGRLDVVAAADVRLALEEAVASGSGDLVLDLVGAHRKAGRSGRTLVLRDVPPAAARLLRRTRLDRVLRQTRTAAAWA